MCTTSDSTYRLSSVCFKWHKCIVKRHTYLWGADKQPNTNSVFFFWIPRSVDCSDFEHSTRNTEMHTTWRRLETTVYSSVSVCPWQSPASPWTWNEERAAGPVTLSLAGAATSIIFVVTKHVIGPNKSMLVATKPLSWQNYVSRHKIVLSRPKTCFVATTKDFCLFCFCFVFVCRNKYLSQQKCLFVFRGKNMFDATSRLLSRQ